MTKEEIFRDRVNREAELMVPDQPMPEIDNKRLLQEIKERTPRDYEPGLYNFCKYTVKSIILV